MLLRDTSAILRHTVTFEVPPSTIIGFLLRSNRFLIGLNHALDRQKASATMSSGLSTALAGRFPVGGQFMHEAKGMTSPSAKKLEAHDSLSVP